ncbi:unnamed protein product [Fraxinus pennsylvanica]|uniref:Uncharacterized protein n=1 Tax=Fraxinus pennsylvanica TaxID=56036 RepID=A0AAD2DPW1_9LAMI|nr:unnamed protein product [Fraxinus pennsylvanica]
MRLNVDMAKHLVVVKFELVWKGQGSRKWKHGHNDGFFIQFESPLLRRLWFVPSSTEKGQILCRYTSVLKQTEASKCTCLSSLERVTVSDPLEVIAIYGSFLNCRKKTTSSMSFL